MPSVACVVCTTQSPSTGCLAESCPAYYWEARSGEEACGRLLFPFDSLGWQGPCIGGSAFGQYNNDTGRGRDPPARLASTRP